MPTANHPETCGATLVLGSNRTIIVLEKEGESVVSPTIAPVKCRENRQIRPNRTNHHQIPFQL